MTTANAPTLRIGFRLVGNDLAMAITGEHIDVPGNPVLLQRSVLSLNSDSMEALSRGEITQGDLDGLVEQLNAWLLDTQFRQLLTTVLPTNGSRLRLVFVLSDESRPLLGPLPFEFLWHDTPDNFLVLRNDIQCLVYKLEKAPTAASSTAASNWPFKVLLVRTSPPDLDPVPEISKLRDRILEVGQRFGTDMVQVDVISAEPGVDVPATWSRLRDHLDLTDDYTVLVYLGHGELIQQGDSMVGQLFMESADGGGHQPISSPQIAKLLQKHPIPIVILTGCVTGADPPGVQRRRAGAQGVAQALVNSSEAGVQVAVGMRTELRTDAAERFLKVFFTALLDPETGGNIDASVRSARQELFLDGLIPPSWAAPVVFRSSEREPMLEYLAQPVSFEISQDMLKFLEMRAGLWKSLPDFVKPGADVDSLNRMKAAIASIEQLLVTEGVLIGPLLMPRHAVGDMGTEVTIPVDLKGTLAVRSLSGRVLIEGSAASVKKVALTSRASGFTISSNQEDRSSFEVVSKTNAPQALPAGELLIVTADVSAQTTAGVYPITIEVASIDPPVKYWPGDNVLVVRSGQ